jgi:hypothetical protein
MRDQRNNVMRDVKINRDELLTIVRANKEKHIADYDASVIDFRAAVLKITKQNLKLAQSDDVAEIAKIRPIPMMPTSYADSYTRAIRMLELSVEDVIEVDATTFNQLVLDEWQWKQQFTAMSSTYKSI